MKPYFKTFCCLFLVLPFIAQAQKFDPKKVVPKSLVKYNFGMSLEDFTRKNKTATTSGSMSFRIEYNDNTTADNIKKVTYYFDAEDRQPLYEMIIVFKDLQSLDAHCSKKLGAPNDGKEWKWTTKEGHIFKAWRFSNTLVLALGLPATEWEKEWDN